MRLVLLFLLCILNASTASAQLIVDHQAKANQGQLQLSPALLFSEAEYDPDGGGSQDIERKIFGLAFGYGVHPSLDVYAELGYIIESELESVRDDDDGFMLGFGVRGQLYQQNAFKLKGFAGARYVDEEYGNGIEGSLWELYSGITGRWELSREVGLYGGFDLIPYTDGEVDSRVGSQDFDRDDPIGIRVGADFTLNNGVRLNGEIALISDESFILRATFPL